MRPRYRGSQLWRIDRHPGGPAGTDLVVGGHVVGSWTPFGHSGSADIRGRRQEAVVEIIEGPSVVAKPERTTAGIRTVTPFRGMFAVRDELMEELFERLDTWGVDFRPVFFRLHVVDMAGAMDIEVGAVTQEPVTGDDRVRPSVLPAGRYATLTYVDHGRRANRTLVEWVRAEGLKFDSVEDPGGDRFACRYETYLTDPRTERRKTRWQIELAIRLADD